MILPEGHKVPQKRFHSLPVLRNFQNFLDRFWRFLHHWQSEEQLFIEIAANVGQHFVQSDQHVVTTMRRVGESNWLADDLIATHQPINRVLQATWNVSDIFRAGDQQTVIVGDQMYENLNSVGQTGAFKVRWELRQTPNTVKNSDSNAIGGGGFYCH